MITEVYFVVRYYLYTRVGSSGRGVQVSVKVGKVAYKYVLKHLIGSKVNKM